jgi:L-ascorbate metabolism protein UlaG (beta-lactamase superfamily)
VLLSHYHADHFDQKVELLLRKDLPIISTPHAQTCLSDPQKGFTNVRAVDVWQQLCVDVKSNDAITPRIRITGMPGKHVAGTFVEALNDLVSAVPPTNGWMVELGYTKTPNVVNGDNVDFSVGYTIYISGDTLFVHDLAEIPKKYPHVDLMLVHLGGTTLPGPHMPLLMVTMDAVQGIKLLHLIHPDVTIPIHFDDYDVFLSKLGDFKDEVAKAGLNDKVVYLDRGEQYDFYVKKE